MFFKEYLQDPTISSMLRMLDAIDKPLRDKNTQCLESLWKNLTKGKKISFFYLDLEDFKQTDDLYVKMNARGKALTPFENFKADLVGHIAKLEENDKKFKALKLSSNIDNAWTDVFWENRNKNPKKAGEIDDIYFAFLNRFFLNEIICFKTTTTENEYKYTAKDLKKGLTENDNFNFSSDTNKDLDKSLHILSQKELNFYDFKYYSSFLNKDRLYRLNKILLNINKINDYKIFKPTWDKNFDFIPRYIKDEDKEKNDNKEITSITQPQRVLFYAISKYLEKDNFDKEKFKQWLRVVSNIVENADIDSVEAMRGHIRLIDELSENASDIYNYLAKPNSLENIKSKASVEQLIEEACKAKKIIENFEWEAKIIKAEQTAFFKGAIRFLFTDENKKINWHLFERRLDKSEKYFDKDGVIKDCSTSFISGFIKSIDDWWSFFNKELFDWKASRFKKNILDPLYLTSISKCLDCEKLEDIKNVKFKDYDRDSGENKIKEEILNKDLIKYIVTSMGEARLYGYPNSYEAIYKKNAKNDVVIVLRASQSNKKTTLIDRIGILNKYKDKYKDLIVFENEVVIDGYYLGWTIKFVYKDCLFLWDGTGLLKFLGAKDNKEKKEIILEKITEENFINTLDETIRESKTNENIGNIKA